MAVSAEQRDRAKRYQAAGQQHGKAKKQRGNSTIEQQGNTTTEQQGNTMLRASKRVLLLHAFSRTN